MTTEKFLRQRVLKQNIEMTTLTSRIDSLRSSNIDLEEQLKDSHNNHLSFISELQEQVTELTKQLQDLKMDMCRTELDKSLQNR